MSTTTCCNTNCPNAPKTGLPGFPAPFKVGDRVRFTESRMAAEDRGTLGTVEMYHNSQSVYVRRDRDGLVCNVFTTSIEHYEEPEPEFKVGDYVAVKLYLGDEIIAHGEIVNIEPSCYSGELNHTVVAADGHEYVKYARNIEHAERPVEFKVGDYVRLVAGTNIGATGEVVGYSVIENAVNVRLENGALDLKLVTSLEHAERPPVPLEPYAYVADVEGLEALPVGSVVMTAGPRRFLDGRWEDAPIVRVKWVDGDWQPSAGSTDRASDSRLAEVAKDHDCGFLLLHHG